MSANARLERLLNLTAALLDTPRPITAEELRGRIAGYPPDKASFRRQFERDKEALRELGIPLTVVDLSTRGGPEQVGYRILPEQYELTDHGLTDDETSALHLAARLISVDGLPGEAATWKLSAGGGSGAPLDGLAGGELPAGERVAELFALIAQRRRACFAYRGEARVVVPEQVRFSNGHWYLAAFDEGRGEPRSFRLDRIDGAVTAGDVLDEEVGDTAAAARERAGARSFSRPWELGSGAPVPVRILFDRGHADWAQRHLGALDGLVADAHDADAHDADAHGAVELRADGSVVVTLQVRNRDALHSFVLGFLEHAEILSPPDVRAELLHRLTTLVATDDDTSASGRVDDAMGLR